MCKALEMSTTPIKDLPVDKDAEAAWSNKIQTKKPKVENTSIAKQK